ncbi:MAG: hypothetical protein HY446_00790 [Candidatus Niyogibacteria bacterium]|nr:hypothetical protein [Candidatus Niyogibacteria bacterium]
MKTIVVAGLVIFLIIVLAIVILPFFLGVTFSRPAGAGQAEDQGLFVSEDGASTWQARNDVKDSKSKLSGLVINDFVIDPQNHDRLYIGTGNSGVWKSFDKGQSWEKVVDKAGVLDPKAQVLRLRIAKTNPQLWFLAVYQKNRGAVLKSEDGGETFKEVYFVSVERFGVFDLSYNDATGEVTVVNGQGGLLQSRDKGRSWRVVKWFSDGLVGLVVDPRAASTFYVLTSKGKIFKTTDSGASFVDLSSGFASFDRSYKNQNLTIDPLSGTLYLGSDYGLIRSFNGGLSWERVPVIIPPEALPVLSVAVHPNDSRIFFASAQSQIYKTVDGGTNWSIVLSPTTQRVTKLVIEKSNPNRIYLISNR